MLYNTFTFTITNIEPAQLDSIKSLELIPKFLNIFIIHFIVPSSTVTRNALSYNTFGKEALMICFTFSFSDS